MASFGAGKLAIVWDERNQKATDVKSQVGMQLRYKNGEHLSIGYLTPDTVSASYPVIAPVNENNLLVSLRHQKGWLWGSVVSAGSGKGVV